MKNRYKYAVRKIPTIINKERIDLSVIVIVDDDTGCWVKMTNYADFLLYIKSTRDGTRFGTNIGTLNDVVKFLNAMIFSDKPKVSSPLQISPKLAQAFLDEYAATPIEKTGKLPRKETVKHMRKSVSFFLDDLAYIVGDEMQYIKPGDMVKIFSVKGSDNRMERRYDFLLKIHTMREVSGYVQLERDMPLGIVDRFIKYARIYDPELEFEIVLMAYMGLRQGTVCNVRQKGSKFGDGLKLTLIHTGGLNGKEMECSAFELNLGYVYPLRSDMTSVGELKKKNKTLEAFGPFTKIIYESYKRHLELISNKRIEDTRPMFLNRTRKNGVYMAMSKCMLRDRIQELFSKHVLPSCKDDDDKDMQVFYHRMQGKTWGAHAFRHWFTVVLVLAGCDAPRIKQYRGDTSIESANHYLVHKKMFEETYKKAAEKLGLKIMGGKKDDNT